MSDDAEIRAGIEARVRAVRAKDVEGLMAHYAPDVATFDIVPPLGNHVGYRKLDGRWLVTHQHSSVPFDMTTGKPRLDLGPAAPRRSP